MSRIDTFAFRVNQDERRMIAALAERLRRSQSLSHCYQPSAELVVNSPVLVEKPYLQ